MIIMFFSRASRPGVEYECWFVNSCIASLRTKTLNAEVRRSPENRTLHASSFPPSSLSREVSVNEYVCICVCVWCEGEEVLGPPVRTAIVIYAYGTRPPLFESSPTCVLCLVPLGLEAQ